VSDDTVVGVPPTPSKSPAATTAPPTTAPRRLGQFEIRRLLGKGGMGEVFEGFDVELQRRVAVKLLAPTLAQDGDFVEAFLAEARLAARLDHPNVCRVHHLGRDDDGATPYIVMEFVEGQTVGQLLKRRGALPAVEALAIVRQTAEALKAARAAGVLHRDVKPSNLMVADDGTVKVTDFGLARLLESSSSLSATDRIVGTPHYISPEAGQGRRCDHRSDIYSLGATLFHLVTGRVPFDGPTPLSVLDAHLRADVPDPATLHGGVPRPLADLIKRMLAKDAENRPADYDEVLAGLDAVAAALGAHQDVQTLTAPTPVDVVVPKRRWWPVALLILVVAGGMMVPPTEAPVQGPEPGKPFAGDLGIELVWVPPGTFTMGLAKDAPGRDHRETPQHEVTIRKGFWLGRTEVTQVQWARLGQPDPSVFKGPRRPVDSVDHDAATTFCRLLTWHERGARRLPKGLTYALPSDAQWE